MSQSYIPNGTTVICTNMTNDTPQPLVVIRKKQTVPNTKGILLNIDDRKIKDTFVCKNTSKFWGGLTSMCAGIAMGALVVLAIAAATAAEVASGGLATPVILALIGLGASSAGMLGSAMMLGIKSHDCDYSMDTESEWLHFHPTVKLDQNNAVLHQSVLKCKKGGMISIFLDDKLAQEAANEISRNNNQEVEDHNTSQFFEGLIGGVTSLSGIGVCIGLGFSIWDYTSDESEMEENEAKFAEARFEESENSKGFATDEMGESEEKRTGKFVYRDSPAGVAGDLGYTFKTEGKEGAEEYFTKTTFKGEGADFMGKGILGTLKSLGVGLVGAVISTAIDVKSNEKEGEHFNDAIKENIKARIDDMAAKNKGIAVIANQ